MKSDFQKYQNLQTQMRNLITEGKHDSPEFQAAWLASEEIKNRHGGLPAIPEGFDPDAFEQEQCELEVERGNR